MLFIAKCMPRHGVQKKYIPSNSKYQSIDLQKWANILIFNERRKNNPFKFKLIWDTFSRRIQIYERIGKWTPKCSSGGRLGVVWKGTNVLLLQTRRLNFLSTIAPIESTHWSLLAMCRNNSLYAKWFPRSTFWVEIDLRIVFFCPSCGHLSCHLGQGLTFNYLN